MTWRVVSFRVVAVQTKSLLYLFYTKAQCLFRAKKKKNIIITCDGVIEMRWTLCRPSPLAHDVSQVRGDGRQLHGEPQKDPHPPRVLQATLHRQVTTSHDG